ncbi:hypothetical protein D3C80_2229620 [compost metagenome]
MDFYKQCGFELDGIDLSFYTNNDMSDGEVAFFMKKRTGLNILRGNLIEKRKDSYRFNE